MRICIVIYVALHKLLSSNVSQYKPWIKDGITKIAYVSGKGHDSNASLSAIEVSFSVISN